MMRRSLSLFSLQKPYAPAVWGFLLFFVLCFVFYPGGMAGLYASADADDYMRLAQVQRWLMGQSWFDLSVPMLGWGKETIVPWSRLVDLPLAFVAELAAPFVGLRKAVEIAGLKVPVFLLAFGLLPVCAAMSRGILPRAVGVFACLVLFGLGKPLLAQFAPARADHHAYQLIIGGLTYVFLLRIVLVRARFAPLFAAVAFAAGLWIGVEIVPSLVLFAGCLAFMAVWRGGIFLRVGAIFGCALAFLAPLALVLARPMQSWMVLDISWFSGAYVLFSWLIGGVFVSGWALGRCAGTRFLRMVLFVVLSAAAIVTFFLLVPLAQLGPYANFEEGSGALVLGHVTEAQPLVRTLWVHAGWNASTIKNYLVVLGLLVGPVAAFVFALRQAVVRSSRARFIGTIAALYLGCFLAAAFFWQFRVYTYVQLYSVLPLSLLLWRWMRRFDFENNLRLRFWKRTGTFLILTFLPTVLLPSLLFSKPVYPDTVLFYGQRRAHACDMTRAIAFLSDPEKMGGSSRRIANMMDQGGELIFKTPHAIMSAPYNVVTNAEALAFFQARDMKEARKIAQRNKIELVVSCRQMPSFYAGLDRSGGLVPGIVAGEDGKLRILSNAKAPTIAERLAVNETFDWLRPVDGFSDPQIVIYETTGKGEAWQ